MPAEPAFVHLHVHSAYSLLEGALTIARLAELAKQDRQPALARLIEELKRRDIW